MESLIEAAAVAAVRSGDRDFHRAWRKLAHALSTATSTTPIPLPAATDAFLSVATDAKTGPLRRMLCAQALRRLLPSDSPALSRSVRAAGDASAAHATLLGLLLALGGDRALHANVANVALWVAAPEPPLRHAALPALLATARRLGATALPQGVVQPAEEALTQLLVRAPSAASAAAASAASPWRLVGSAGAQQHVLEPDGTVARDCFTVLCATSGGSYTLEQHLNHHVFAALHGLLAALHDAGGRHAIDPRFSEAVVFYCTRVIDQAKLPQQSLASSSASTTTTTATASSSLLMQLPTSSRAAGTDSVGFVAFAESLRILDFLCSNNSALLTRLFPMLKRGASLPTSQADGHVFLAYLQFLLNHSTAVAYDVEPFFSKFFDSFFAGFYTDQIVCFETLEFCMRNAEKLLQTKVFHQYFPSLLKALAWHTLSLFADFVELLPALVSASSFVELLNSLFDLPLLAAALEAQQARRVNEFQFGFAEEDSGGFRVLTTHLLRSQAGVSESFWAQEPTRLLVQQYFQSSPVTERVLAASRLVRPLVERVFRLLFEHGTDDHLQALLLVLFHRFDPRQLFPNADFRRDVQTMVLTQILEVFEAHPEFIVSLRKPIVELLSSTTARDASGELVLALVWVVGEFLCPTTAKAEIPRDILNDYYEALELIVFEQMAAVKIVISSSGHGSAQQRQQGSEEAFATRLALVVVGALSKFAARWPFFSSRVVICLGKLASIAESMHPSVLERTNECIAVLKYPSVAAAVMGSHRPRGSPLTDANSSLPFLLQSASSTAVPVPFADEGPLHHYSLHAIEEETGV